MAQVRINELGRELEIKPKLIVDYLPQLGVTEKKTHSSSIDEEIAEKVRAYFHALEAQEQEDARRTTEAKMAAQRAAAERVAAERAATERAVADRLAAERAAQHAAGLILPELLAAIPMAPRAPAPGGARTLPRPAPPVAPAAAARPLVARPAAAPAATATASAVPQEALPGRATPLVRATASAAPEPGKPIYERKPAAPRTREAGKTHLDKRFAEGERKLKHPVRARVRHEPEDRKAAAAARREAAVAQRPALAITITEGMTVKDLAERLEVRAKDVIKVLLDRRMLATINQSLDTALAAEVAKAFNATASILSFEEESLQEVTVAKAGRDRAQRAPVVTVMGHVDHGKTSLLDAIRETELTALEAGGITQHIGAYQVVFNARPITFIDTPGHEAFTRMRARGAKVTDIVVLVVAADDGVMPQTLEAIDHARAAKVPLVVAINKIDKPGALPERVKKQLADRGLMPEAWGGDTVMIEVSAKKKTNLDHLLEMILLVADLQELKADASLPATGAVLEARLDRGRGPVASVLVQDGTLRLGDPFIVGPIFGKVRALFDDRAQPLTAAGPATPVEVLGLAGLPEAGDQFQVVADEVKAKQVAAYREQRRREAALGASRRLTLEQLHQQLQTGEVKELPLILKADVQGSVEALSDQLDKMATDKVKIKIIHSGVGGISETDVLLASASNAVVIGFSVRPERKVADLAEHEGVDIRLHNVIYEVLDEMQLALAGLLEPTVKETILGRAEVREVFRIPRVGAVAGCYVTEGKLVRDASVRVVRDSAVIYQSKLASLRRFKDDVKEVASGFECGATVSNFADVKVGDVLEVFHVEKIVSAAAMVAGSSGQAVPTASKSSG